MSVRSITGGNLTLNNLDVTTINGLPPGGGGSETLAQTLALGNSAGTTDINMNFQDILTVNNINLVTINGVAYPPPSPAGTVVTVTNGLQAIVPSFAGNQLSTFTLPAGVWTINMCINFGWTTDPTVITQQAVSLQSAPTFGAGESIFYSDDDPLTYNIGTGGDTVGVSNWTGSYTCALLAPQPFYLMYQAQFTGSGNFKASTALNPLGYSMKAVCLA